MAGTGIDGDDDPSADAATTSATGGPPTGRGSLAASIALATGGSAVVAEAMVAGAGDPSAVAARTRGTA